MAYEIADAYKVGDPFGYQSANRFRNNEIYLKTWVQTFELPFLLGENISALYAVHVFNNVGTIEARKTASLYYRAVGVLSETGTTGQTKDVVLFGGTVTGFTGETPGEKAYIQTTGAIGSTVTDYPAGRFISSTELYLTKNP